MLSVSLCFYAILIQLSDVYDETASTMVKSVVPMNYSEHVSAILEFEPLSLIEPSGVFQSISQNNLYNPFDKYPYDYGQQQHTCMACSEDIVNYALSASLFRNKDIFNIIFDTGATDTVTPLSQTLYL